MPTSAKLISRPAAVKTVTDAHQISRNRRDRGTGLRNEYILGRVGRDFSILGQCSGMSPEPTVELRLEEVLHRRGDRARHGDAVRISGGDECVLTVPGRAELHGVTGHRAAVAIGRAARVFVCADA
jgi:hypothetical protein